MTELVKKKATILAVDDTPANLELLGALLGSLYRVKIAKSGERALTVLHEQDLPDLILLDVLMPGLSGWDVCKQLKQDPRLKDIPVIFLTSKVEVDDEKQGFEVGAVDYITKPINPPVLLARVKTHLLLKEVADFLKDNNTLLELEVKRRIAEIAEQQKQLQSLSKLKRFFSEQVASQIMQPGGEDLLKPHRREISVVFCDLRGFTPIVAEAEPEEVMKILADYHQVVGEQVTRFNGTIEHFEGDGVMIFFNDPLQVEGFSLLAINMAQEIQRLFKDVQDKWARQNIKFGLGMGIARGFATLGMIGYEGRLDYAAIGTVTNLAARLCSQAADGEILFDAKIFANLKTTEAIINTGFHPVKGFTHQVEVFKLERGAALVDGI